MAEEDLCRLEMPYLIRKHSLPLSAFAGQIKTVNEILKVEGGFLLGNRHIRYLKCPKKVKGHLLWQRNLLGSLPHIVIDIYTHNKN